MRLIFDTAETITIDLIWNQICAGYDQNKPVTILQMTKNQLDGLFVELGFKREKEIREFKIYGVPVEIYHPNAFLSPT